MNRSILVLATCLLASGCSKSDKATVAGTVTVDGQPAQLGFVSFFAVDGRAPTSGGPINDGRYTAQVKPGLCRVQIRVPRETGQRKLYDTPDSPVAKTWAESLPAKYNEATELQFDVKPGTNESNYDLKTK
jgi:hypothetical protein